MSNPQKENGYSAIANQILEALARIRIPGEARQVLDVVFRKTYGFNKKEDWISLSQFMFATGLRKVNIIRSRKRLVMMKLIVIKFDNNRNVIYRINKNFESWLPLSKMRTSQKHV